MSDFYCHFIADMSRLLCSILILSLLALSAVEASSATLHRFKRGSELNQETPRQRDVKRGNLGNFAAQRDKKASTFDWDFPPEE